MEENVILIAFACLPVITAMLLYLFFSKFAAYFGKILWLKLVVGNALVFLFLCSTALLAGEVYYRFWYDKTDSMGLTKAYWNWLKRHYHYNNFEMRDSVDYQLKLQGKPRITFIGDSFTAGHGITDVEKRFVNLIREARSDWEIHCFAKNGWDTYAYMDYMTKSIESGYEFDHIVLIYNLNDISDLMEKWKGILIKLFFTERPFLFHHSYFFNMLYYHYIAARDPDVSNYFSFIAEAYNGPLWESQKLRLSVLKPFFDSKGIDFMVVTFPFVQNLGPDYKYSKICEQMDTFWKDANVPNLDLLPVFEQNKSKNLVINANDPHPNELAHEIAAKAILEFLDKNMKNRTRPVSATTQAN